MNINSKNKTIPAIILQLSIAVLLLIGIIILIVESKKILISSMEETGKNISINLILATDAGKLIFFALVLGLIDIVLWVRSIMTIIKSIKSKKTLVEGELCEAKYVAHKSNIELNGMPYFNIVYTYVDKYGNIKEDSSARLYSAAETMVFKELKTFHIKVNKNSSVIITNPQEHLKVLIENNNTCPYCKCIIEENTIKCPICGAIQSKK